MDGEGHTEARSGEVVTMLQAALIYFLVGLVLALVCFWGVPLRFPVFSRLSLILFWPLAFIPVTRSKEIRRV